jgi:hypothetical protein
VQFYNSKGFYTNTNLNKKIEFTRLSQGIFNKLSSLLIYNIIKTAINNTKTNFYDSTFYDSTKSKFGKQSEFSFSPQNISVNTKTKPNVCFLLII